MTNEQEAFFGEPRHDAGSGGHENSDRSSFGGSGGGGFRKRKRKSGFFARAKKFGQQGKLGHGYEIDTETYSYFLRVLEMCQKNEFENDEEKGIFIENAFTQTENEEVNLSSNQMTSRVLEVLLADTNNAEILTRFTEQFTPQLRTICTDPYASHVLEKLLYVISTKWTTNKALVKWFRSTCQYVLNNFEEFIFDNFANRIMRKVCQCLSGSADLFLSAASKQQSLNQMQNSSSKFVQPSFKDLKQLRVTTEESEEDSKAKKYIKRNAKILKKFSEQFINWPQFNDLFQREITSGFVQSLLTTLVAVDDDLVSDGVMQVIKAIKEEFDIHVLPQLFTIEVCLAVSQENETIYKLVYFKYLQSKLSTFVVDGYGHFTLERLLSTMLDSNLFEEVYDALECHLQTIYDRGYFSVMTAISEACLRLKTRQSNFVDKLAVLLEEPPKGDDPEDPLLKKMKADEDVPIPKRQTHNFVETLCRFGKPEISSQDGTGKPYRTELHGCLVLQNILQYHKPFKVVTSLLELDGLLLKRLATDPKGSHVVDSFLKSPTISEKYKDQFMSCLKEYFVTLATQKFGARVLDNYWAIASMKNKTLIASCLSERVSQLNADTYGKFLSIKCGLSLYKRSPKQWAEFMTTQGQAEKKKNKLTEDIRKKLGLDPSRLLKSKPKEMS